MGISNQYGRKTARNILWNYGAFILEKGFIFLNTIILARLLSPDDFGLLALGLVTIGYLEVFNDFGISTAIIYYQKDPEKSANVAFVYNMLLGMLLTTFAFLTAPWIAVFFNDDRLINVLRILSFNFVLSSLGSVHAARLKKELHFKRRLLPEVSKALTKGVVAIVLALNGWGVWSLVWGQIIGTTIASILYWIAYRWIPKIVFNFTLGRNLLAYGIQMVGVDFIGQIHHNIDYLLIGKRLDSTQLGYYSIAFRLPEMIIMNLVVVVGQVIFPTYAKVQSNRQLLQEGYLTTLRYVALLVLPVGTGMFVLTPDFIVCFFTTRWAMAIPTMQVLCVYAMVYSLGYNCGDIYKATGRLSILMNIGLIKIALVVPILFIAAGYGIYEVALGQLATTTVLSVIHLSVANRIVQTRWRQVSTAIFPAVLSSTIMLIIMTILYWNLESIALFLRMVLLIFCGSLVYVACLWLFDKTIPHQLVALLRSKNHLKAS